MSKHKTASEEIELDEVQTLFQTSKFGLQAEDVNHAFYGFYFFAWGETSYKTITYNLFLFVLFKI